MGAQGPEEEEDSMAQLRELLGSDAWAPGGASAQAALAQASNLAAPALQPEPALSGRPPLHKGSPRPAKAAAVSAPAAMARQAERHTEPEPVAQPSSSADSSCQAELLAEPASREEPSSQADTYRPTAVFTEPGSSGGAAFTETQMQEDQGSTVGGNDARTGLSARGKEEAASIPLSEEGRAEYVRNLTAKIAAAAQQAALGAVSSSVEVASHHSLILLLLFTSFWHCCGPSDIVQSSLDCWRTDNNAWQVNPAFASVKSANSVPERLPAMLG